MLQRGVYLVACLLGCVCAGVAAPGPLPASQTTQEGVSTAAAAWIVGFRGHFPHEAHAGLVADALAAAGGTPPCVQWSVLQRQPRVRAFPSDFALVQVRDFAFVSSCCILTSAPPTHASPSPPSPPSVFFEHVQVSRSPEASCGSVTDADAAAAFVAAVTPHVKYVSADALVSRRLSSLPDTHSECVSVNVWGRVCVTVGV